MNERKAQINCTYIFYVPIYIPIHTSLSKMVVFNPSTLWILFCADSQTHTHTRTYTVHRPLISGGFYPSKKSRQPNKKSLSIFFSMHKIGCDFDMWCCYLSHSISFFPLSRCWLVFQIIHTLSECVVVPYASSASLHLFIYSCEANNNKSISKIDKTRHIMVTTQHGLSLCLSKLATHINLFTRWMNFSVVLLSVVHIVHVDIVIAIRWCQTFQLQA